MRVAVAVEVGVGVSVESSVGAGVSETSTTGALVGVGVGRSRALMALPPSTSEINTAPVKMKGRRRRAGDINGRIPQRGMNNETMNNEQTPNPRHSPRRTREDQIPKWLWKMVVWGFGGLVIGIGALVVAVAMGVADPKPMGALQWEDHFADTGRWQTFGDEAEFGAGGLTVSPGEAGEVGGAVWAGAAPPFTFEVAAAQIGGEAGAAYGLVFGYRNQNDYSAVMLNGNGYARVFATDRREWMAWQQWPNILLGTEANRLRVDVANGEGLIRINDEVLMHVPVGAGGVGVIARASAGGQRVIFGWAKYWAK